MLLLCSIRWMKGVTKVGDEFSGNASSLFKPFRSLETLSFDGMPEWEEWDASGVEEFSHLLDLSIVDCPKLTGELSIRFPSLRKLKISGCHQLGSNQVRMLLQSLSSVQELEISNIPNLTELPQQVQHLSSLRKLKISNIPNLTELPQQVEQLSSLQELEISDIPKLMMLPHELCRLVNLERLKIEECARVVSFPDVGLLPMLKTLEIRRCKALLSLSAVPSEETMNNNSLEELVISDCSSLVQVSLPIATLKTLEIYKCRRLEFPQLWEEMEEHNHKASLEDLRIDGCDLLKSLSLGFFPKLRSLEISGCINMEMLVIPNKLQNLVRLEIRNCPKMVSFPHGNGNGDGEDYWWLPI